MNLYNDRCGSDPLYNYSIRKFYEQSITFIKIFLEWKFKIV